MKGLAKLGTVLLMFVLTLAACGGNAAPEANDSPSVRFATGEIIPAAEGFNHFGMGQTETELELEPGEYTLCLQVGDGIHAAVDLVDEITITVE